jgi:hypothetical protein
MDSSSRRSLISDAHPSTSRTLCSRVPLLVWNSRAQYGDRPSRDSPRQPDGRAQLARGTLRLVHAIGLAFFLWFYLEVTNRYAYDEIKQRQPF